MLVLHVRNVHRALPVGVALLEQKGTRIPTSRGGVTWEYDEPVATVYAQPRERVLFWPERDANPFFHLFESIHMLAGRRDVESLAFYNSRMREYSDDGMIFHGAYGHRWRVAFGIDQLSKIIELLTGNPGSRQAVLQMWHCVWDLGAPTKDQPCNTTVYFKIRDGRLRMTVCCRSNDIVWGAYGANAVHLSILQEYIADRIGVPVGPYVQISDSYHAYETVWEKLFGLSREEKCPYENDLVSPTPLHADDPNWDDDAARLFESRTGYQTWFFTQVVDPLDRAWRMHKSGNTHRAIQLVNLCEGPDWRRAAREWLERRLAKQRVE